MSSLIWVQTVYKELSADDNVMSCKSLTQSLNISVQLQLVITYKVSNSLDPDKALTEYRPDLGPNCLQWVISR